MPFYLIQAHFSAMQQNIQLIEISEHQEKYDLVESCYVFKHIYDAFPKGTLHLFLVDSALSSNETILTCENEGHSFIFQNNGVQSLIFENPVQLKELLINKDELPLNRYLSAAQLIIENKDYDQWSRSFDQPVKFSQTALVNKDNSLYGTVMHNDVLGNAHTNIHKDDFHQFIGNQPFRIHLSRFERISTIETNLVDVREGDPYASFNHKGFLVIGIRKGEASKLLNLIKGRPISIDKQ